MRRNRGQLTPGEKHENLFRNLRDRFGANKLLEMVLEIMPEDDVYAIPGLFDAEVVLDAIRTGKRLGFGIDYLEAILEDIESNEMYRNRRV